MKANITFDPKEYAANPIVKAWEKGEPIQYQPKNTTMYGYWITVKERPDVVMTNGGQLNFLEYNFRIAEGRGDGWLVPTIPGPCIRCGCKDDLIQYKDYSTCWQCDHCCAIITDKDLKYAKLPYS